MVNDIESCLILLVIDRINAQIRQKSNASSGRYAL